MMQRTPNKQLVAILLVSTMLFAVPAGLLSDASENGHAALNEDVTIDGIKYRLSEGNKATVVEGGDPSITRADIRSSVDFGEAKGCEVTSIHGYSFREFRSLVSLTIPDSVVAIGDLAFAECSSLQTAKIGKGASFKDLGHHVFFNCTSLVSINVDPDNTELYSSDGVLFGRNGDKNGDHVYLIQYPIGKAIDSYDVPENVESIVESAFENCSKLRTVNLNDGLQNIGKSAFNCCSSLKSITIPDGIRNIELYAFCECPSLETATIGNGVDGKIGSDVFADCNALKTVSIGDGFTQMGSTIFEGCTNLNKFTLGVCKLEDCDTCLDEGLEYIGIAEGATGFDPLFYYYTFFDKDGKELEDESAIAGHMYKNNGKGEMTALVEHGITYDVDGGSKPAPTQGPLFESETFIVADYDGTKDGYTFKGWDDGTKIYRPGSTYTMGDKDVTLRAV